MRTHPASTRTLCTRSTPKRRRRSQKRAQQAPTSVKSDLATPPSLFVRNITTFSLLPKPTLKRNAEKRRAASKYPHKPEPQSDTRRGVDIPSPFTEQPHRYPYDRSSYSCILSAFSHHASSDVPATQKPTASVKQCPEEREIQMDSPRTRKRQPRRSITM
ncbi:hypothetical protein BV898_19632 [Hypsibius exemplaris]|uniref:Uncharacterized protein n=1 Tax=Hypsibius exemplaris TaxID=2072580 RepID=A0A9X6NL87_HYPEX|nr:hypothetical protein BV898_19632 [Hypsibius exemplaris]